jgi:drug/metabolite transporter (DMT)-like permease
MVRRIKKNQRGKDMSPLHIIWAIACVLIIACGQLLFKKAGMEIQAIGHWASWRVLTVVGAALFIYGVATLLWISLLRYVPLNKAYVFMALSFVLVPIASFFIFREQITPGYWAGVGLIVTGVIVAAKF